MVVAVVGGARLRRQLGIVRDAAVAPAHRAVVEEVGTEEARLDDGDLDTEGLDLRREGLREAFDGELGSAVGGGAHEAERAARSEEHTSELQSLMRISYAVFCLKKKNKTNITQRRSR